MVSVTRASAAYDAMPDPDSAKLAAGVANSAAAALDRMATEAVEADKSYGAACKGLRILPRRIEYFVIKKLVGNEQDMSYAVHHAAVLREFLAASICLFKFHTTLVGSAAHGMMFTRSPAWVMVKSFSAFPSGTRMQP